ncbi:MAG: hypothetical protein M1826_005717, partial [Phylliscum demangeonii]
EVITPQPMRPMATTVWMEQKPDEVDTDRDLFGDRALFDPWKHDDASKWSDVDDDKPLPVSDEGTAEYEAPAPPPAAALVLNVVTGLMHPVLFWVASNGGEDVSMADQGPLDNPLARSQAAVTAELERERERQLTDDAEPFEAGLRLMAALEREEEKTREAERQLEVEQNVATQREQEQLRAAAQAEQQAAYDHQLAAFRAKSRPSIWPKRSANASPRRLARWHASSPSPKPPPPCRLTR